MNCINIHKPTNIVIFGMVVRNIIIFKYAQKLFKNKEKLDYTTLCREKKKLTFEIRTAVIVFIIFYAIFAVMNNSHSLKKKGKKKCIQDEKEREKERKKKREIKKKF